MDMLAQGTPKKPLCVSRCLVTLAREPIPVVGIIYLSPFHLLQNTDLFPIEAEDQHMTCPQGFIGG